jgi:hypothetical protein
MFLDKLVKKYAVNAVTAAVKIPSYTDDRYQKEFKFPKVNRNETATHSFGNNGAKIVISLFPEWTKEDHLAAAAKHEKDADKMDRQWSKLRDEAHKKTFGKPAGFHDYKVSGIGRSEYPEDMKEKLRELAHGATKAKALSYAHATAAKIVKRFKNLKQPVKANTMSRSDALKYVSYVVDDALSILPLSKLDKKNAVLVGWQCGFEPLFVAVQSYLNVKITEDEAEDIARDLLEEKKWFSKEPKDADYILMP